MPDEWRWRFRCYPSRVIDGDTFIAAIDLGFRTLTEQAIRLLGVNAPELPTAEGVAAKAAAELWFVDHLHGAGRWPFVLDTDRDRMTFARWLGTVTCLEGHTLGGSP